MRVVVRTRHPSEARTLVRTKMPLPGLNETERTKRIDVAGCLYNLLVL